MERVGTGTAPKTAPGRRKRARRVMSLTGSEQRALTKHLKTAHKLIEELDRDSYVSPERRRVPFTR